MHVILFTLSLYLLTYETDGQYVANPEINNVSSQIYVDYCPNPSAS
ncbi:hypothetical protein [Alteromonas sp. a30]|nr:hypothetical protein [Alteromonas sp. a30]MCY7296314.1 hypothetical protein [Alteromonas sp. a30]